MAAAAIPLSPSRCAGIRATGVRPPAAASSREAGASAGAHAAQRPRPATSAAPARSGGKLYHCAAMSAAHRAAHAVVAASAAAGSSANGIRQDPPSMETIARRSTWVAGRCQRSPEVSSRAAIRCAKTSEREATTAIAAAAATLRRRAGAAVAAPASAKAIHHGPPHSSGSPTVTASEPHALSSATPAGTA